MVLIAVDQPGKYYLVHYRTKGSKNGVRRWQYEDGSLTPAGRIHYGIGNGNRNGRKQNPVKENARIQKDLWDKHYSKAIDSWYEKHSDASIEDQIKADRRYERSFMKALESNKDFKELSIVDLSDRNKKKALFNTLFLPTMPFGLTNVIYNAKASHENKEFEKRLAEREKNGNIDPKTGMYLRNDSTDPAKDIKLINHGFGGFDERNSNNCMLCTTTYDLRRRGYDVYAGQTNFGHSDIAVEKWYRGATSHDWQSFELEAARKLRKNVSGKEPSWRDIDKEAYKIGIDRLKHEPEGSYGNLMLTYKFGGGHSMAYEIKNGKLVIHDGQVGEYSKRPNSMFLACNKIVYYRLDNATPNLDAMRKDGVFV